MPELQHLRNFAASSRRGGFGVPFFKLDGNTGDYRRSGKTNTTTMNGQKLAPDPVDAMTGYQKFENKVPIYHIGRVADGYQPPPREALGDLDEKFWPEGTHGCGSICCRFGIRSLVKFCCSVPPTRAAGMPSRIWSRRTSTISACTRKI